MKMRYMLLCSIFLAPSLFGQKSGDRIWLYNNTVYTVNVEVRFCYFNECDRHLSVLPGTLTEVEVPYNPKYETASALYSIKAVVPAQEVVVNGQKAQREGKVFLLDDGRNFLEYGVFLINANRPKNNDLSLPVEGLVIYRFIQE